jgi:CheY-like chemotaxis protein
MGRGLGLATAYSIVKRHGGNISVTSKLGEGTTFSILFPAHPTSDLEKSGVKTEEPSSLPRAKTILLLDDEEIIHTVVPRWLKNQNWTVTSASEGKEALELYMKAFKEGHRFDIVLLDLTVPGGMGGREVLEAILEFDPSAVGIVSSGYSEDLVVAHFADYGFKAALAKPYTEDKLRETLNAVLSRKYFCN